MWSKARRKEREKRKRNKDEREGGWEERKKKTRCSLLFSRSVVSNSLQPHELQQARLLCFLLYPRVFSNSCPLSWWCHSTISFSATPSPLALNLSHHQGLFQWVNFPSGRQSIVVSVLVLPMNIQCWFPLGLTGLISLQSEGLTKFLLHLICTFTVYIFLWYIVEHLLFKIC